jgi:hypothetical protein
MSEVARVTNGIAKYNAKGVPGCYCARCTKAGRPELLGTYDHDTPWLSSPLIRNDIDWDKFHGVYESTRRIRRNGRSSHRPAPGSKIKCRICQWINIVPDRP